MLPTLQGLSLKRIYKPHSLFKTCSYFNWSLGLYLSLLVQGQDAHIYFFFSYHSHSYQQRIDILFKQAPFRKWRLNPQLCGLTASVKQSQGLLLWRIAYFSSKPVLNWEHKLHAIMCAYTYIPSTTHNCYSEAFKNSGDYDFHAAGAYPITGSW